MPIAVRVVSEADYNTWLQQAKQKYASGGSGGAPTNVAAAGETTGQR